MRLEREDIRGYSFMGKTKAPVTLPVPGLFAIS